MDAHGSDATVSKGRVNGVGIAVTLVLTFAGGFGYSLLWGTPERGLPFWLVTVAIFLAGIVAHEGVHALGYHWFGKLAWHDVRFGVLWRAAMPYAHAAKPMRASAYRKAVLLPGFLTGLVPAIVGFAVGSPELALAGAVLLGAAAGDWLVVAAIRSIPGDRLVLDHPSDVGVRVLADSH